MWEILEWEKMVRRKLLTNFISLLFLFRVSLAVQAAH